MMRNKQQPNNFPVEGAHTPVSAAHLQQLEKHRATPVLTLDYTIGGATETAVHTTIEAARNYAISRGYRILQQHSDQLQAGFDTARQKPLRVDFNAIEAKAAAYRKRLQQQNAPQQVTAQRKPLSLDFNGIRERAEAHLARTGQGQQLRQLPASQER